MNTKLTLRLDEQLIQSAKQHAQSLGKSVSQMVADYFYTLDKTSRSSGGTITPRVKSLRGALKDKGLGEEDYKTYLEDKYL
ncbi:hypothetical protein JCM14469_04950 [Desulfatiferula olefinivorans]